jgi:hypothetical protein
MPRLSPERAGTRDAQSDSSRSMVEWIAGARLLPARGPPRLEMRHVRAPLIASAGEHAPSGHWPILRKRGRGDTGASLGFAVAEESKLLVTRAGRSSGSAKSAGRDLPTGDAVGCIHKHDQHKSQAERGRTSKKRMPCSALVRRMFMPWSSGPPATRVWKQSMSPGGLF